MFLSARGAAPRPAHGARRLRAACGSALAAVALALVAHATAAAEMARVSQRYDVIFRGIRAGEASLEAIVTERQYSLAGQLRSTGLLRTLVNIAYIVRTVGRISDNEFLPLRYRELEQKGRTQAETVIEYDGRAPRVTSRTPPRAPGPRDVDPATQTDTVDPGTAVFLALRDVPRAEACRFQVTLFDGVRRSRLVIARPQPAAGGGLSCTGQYQRLAGYEDWELEGGRITQFTAEYVDAGGGLLAVSELRLATRYGTVVLRRQ